MSDAGHSAGDGGPSGNNETAGTGHERDSGHPTSSPHEGGGQDHGPHREAEPHPHISPRQLYFLLVAAPLTVIIISSFFFYNIPRLGSVLQTASDWYDQLNLDNQTNAERKWKEMMLQATVERLPDAREVAEHIQPLLKLSNNPDKKIKCVARRRLGAAYFFAGQPEKAHPVLMSIEADCGKEPQVVEDIDYLYYLRGRVESELANINWHPDVRKIWENSAWKDYDEAWRQGRPRDFAVVAVLQMCILSSGRSNATIAELKELEERVNDAIMTPFAEKSLVVSFSLSRHERIIKSKRIAQEKQAEEKRLAALTSQNQQQADPFRGVEPKSLKDLFQRGTVLEVSNIDRSVVKPAPPRERVRKSDRVGKPERARKKNRRY